MEKYTPQELIAAQTRVGFATIGMGATQVLYSDSHAYTIIAISKTGKTITVQKDKAIRADKNGMSDCQTYTFERDPQGQTRTVRQTKNGWNWKGERFLVGIRQEYFDYTF